MCDICPVALAGFLDNKIRRCLQNPRTILEPYIKEGMTALDVGCGPGFFSIDMAHLAGKSGSVICADLQDGMLEKIRRKIKGTDLEHTVKLHKCGNNGIGLTEQVDFALAFYMVHEVPDQKTLLEEVKSILKPTGQFLIIEPKYIHVSKKDFERTLETAREVGFKIAGGPDVFFSQSAALINS
ncbi:MAG: class I SAM-dependent methyltransferase [Candidatus Eremiobacterota bacterium]